MERWRQIPNFEPYEASTQGRIRRGERILKPQPAGIGYHKINIKGGQEYVHRLAVSTWIGTIPTGWQVNHLDKTITNNAVENLEIVTPKRNAQHARQPVWYQSQTRLPIFE